MTRPPQTIPAARLAALESDLKTLRALVDETIRVTGCTDARNREADDWLRGFATVYRSKIETEQRAQIAAMLADWQATRRVRVDRRAMWGQIAVGLGVVWTTLLVLQYVGMHAIAAIRALTGGVP